MPRVLMWPYRYVQCDVCKTAVGNVFDAALGLSGEVSSVLGSVLSSGFSSVFAFAFGFGFEFGIETLSSVLRSGLISVVEFGC